MRVMRLGEWRSETRTSRGGTADWGSLPWARRVIDDELPSFRGPVGPSDHKGLPLLPRILLGVLFILGVAAGYGVARSGGADDLSVLDPVETPPASTRQESDVGVPVDATSVEDAIAALASYESYQSRDGVIVGTVATEAGEALAGVTVVARSQEKLPGYEDPTDLDTEAALRQGLALYGLRRGLTSSAETDESGVFRIEQIGSGPYELHAELDGYRFVPAGEDRRSRRVVAGDEVALVGLPAGHVKVEFIGWVPPHANVSIEGSDRRGFRWTSDAEPTLVAAGEVRVEASTPTAEAESVSAVVTAGEVTTVKLDLRSKLSIAGRLIGPPGFRTHRQSIVRVVPDRPGMTEEAVARDRRSALPRYLFAAGNVDHIEGEVDELRTEGRAEVVAPAFHQHQLQPRMTFRKLINGSDVDGSIFADSRMRTTAGFHPQQPVLRKDLGT